MIHEWSINDPCPRPIQIVSIEERIHQIGAAIEVQNATQLKELRAIHFATMVLVQAFEDGIEAQQGVVRVALASTGDDMSLLSSPNTFTSPHLLSTHKNHPTPKRLISVHPNPHYRVSSQYFVLYVSYISDSAYLFMMVES